LTLAAEGADDYRIHLVSKDGRVVAMERVFRDGTALRYARLQPALERMYDERAAEVGDSMLYCARPRTHSNRLPWPSGSTAREADWTEARDHSLHLRALLIPLAGLDRVNKTGESRPVEGETG